MDKKIKINGEDFFYQILTCRMGVFDDIYTIFYKETEKYKGRNFFGFLKKEIKQKPVQLFDVNCNIESNNYSKAEMTEIIMKGYQSYQRKLEIEKGEII